MPMLAAKLKNGTETAHRAAESGAFVKDFIQGKIERHLYKQHIASMWHVYQAMEAELDANATHPCVQPIYHPRELARSQALEADMAYWWGDDWRSNSSITTMSPATSEYAQHIHDAGRRDPEMLVAHSYTRYLGDLSGGQILCRMLRAAFDMPPLKESTQGVEFYMFEKIGSLNDFKKDYRAALDDLPVTDVQSVVAEANLAFMFNMRIFAELEGKELPALATDIAILKEQEELDKGAEERKKYSQYPVARL